MYNCYKCGQIEKKFSKFTLSALGNIYYCSCYLDPFHFPANRHWCFLFVHGCGQVNAIFKGYPLTYIWALVRVLMWRLLSTSIDRGKLIRPRKISLELPFQGHWAQVVSVLDYSFNSIDKVVHQCVGTNWLYCTHVPHSYWTEML